MKTTQKAILIAVIIFGSLTGFAQDTVKTKKIREYHLSVNDFSPLNVSIKYKRQLKNNTFFKVGLVNLSGNIAGTSNSGYYNTSASVGFLVGFEFRKPITDKFTFYHGINLGCSYHATVYETASKTLITENRSLQVPYTLGLLFRLNDHFLLSAEINPGINFVHHGNYNGISTTYNFSSGLNFGTNYGHLALAYRF